MIKLASLERGQVAVERDEDIEVSDDNKIAFIQVKTRTAPLKSSDISKSLQLFNQLRQKYSKTSPEKSVGFTIVSNITPGPQTVDSLKEQQVPE